MVAQYENTPSITQLMTEPTSASIPTTILLIDSCIANEARTTNRSPAHVAECLSRGSIASQGLADQSAISPA